MKNENNVNSETYKKMCNVIIFATEQAFGSASPEAESIVEDAQAKFMLFGKDYEKLYEYIKACINGYDYFEHNLLQEYFESIESNGDIITFELKSEFANKAETNVIVNWITDELEAKVEVVSNTQFSVTSNNETETITDVAYLVNDY